MNRARAVAELLAVLAGSQLFFWIGLTLAVHLDAIPAYDLGYLSGMANVVFGGAMGWISVRTRGVR